MAKNFNELRNKMSPERLAAVDARVQQMIAEMPLAEVRQAQQLTQEQMAETMGVNQATVSKVERQTDMYLSTLRRFIEAAGGHLRLIASFDDREIEIEHLRDPEQPAGGRSSSPTKRRPSTRRRTIKSR